MSELSIKKDSNKPVKLLVNGYNALVFPTDQDERANVKIY